MPPFPVCRSPGYYYYYYRHSSSHHALTEAVSLILEHGRLFNGGSTDISAFVHTKGMARKGANGYRDDLVIEMI